MGHARVSPPANFPRPAAPTHLVTKKAQLYAERFAKGFSPAAAHQVKADLAELNVSQVDLVLLHAPCNSAKTNAKLWQGLEQALAHAGDGVHDAELGEDAYFSASVRRYEHDTKPYSMPPRSPVAASL